MSTRILSYGSLAVLSFGVTLGAIASAHAADPGGRWYKGNTHTHTFWSDGNQFPEMAADWYKQAADRGDREATFALAMMRMAGRGAPANKEEAAKLLAFAAPALLLGIARALPRRLVQLLVLGRREPGPVCDLR